MTSCDISQAALRGYREQLNAITLTTENANELFDELNDKIDEEMTTVVDCINTLKEKMNQPKPSVDDRNTSNAMLQNSKLLHKDIIYIRIQLLFYIFALLYFFHKIKL